MTSISFSTFSKSNCTFPLFRATTALALGFGVALPVTADFRPLGDAAMASVTGQAGVTIEMATKISIGQLTYQDEGRLNVDNIRLSGQNDTMLDNMKLTIDIAGQNEVLDFGFSEIARRADAGTLNPNDPDVADALSAYKQANGAFGKQFNDGDLVMHLGAIDYGDPSSLADFRDAVDFELAIDSIALSKSDGSAPTTTMFSDILLQGNLGPTDLVIRNSGSNRTLSNGNVVSESELQLDSHFEITNGRLNWDVADLILIFNLAAIGIEDLQIHNRRGDDTLGHFGMANVSAKLSKGTSAATGMEGLSIHDVEFRADIDMPVFRVGDNSIGGVYFTDFAITNTSMMVYGH